MKTPQLELYETTDVTEIAKEINSDFYKEYSSVYILISNNDFTVSTVVEHPYNQTSKKFESFNVKACLERKDHQVLIEMILDIDITDKGIEKCK